MPTTGKLYIYLQLSKLILTPIWLAFCKVAQSPQQQAIKISKTREGSRPVFSRTSFRWWKIAHGWQQIKHQQHSKGLKPRYRDVNINCSLQGRKTSILSVIWNFIPKKEKPAIEKNESSRPEYMDQSGMFCTGLSHRSHNRHNNQRGRSVSKGRERKK